MTKRAIGKRAKADLRKRRIERRETRARARQKARRLRRRIREFIARRDGILFDPKLSRRQVFPPARLSLHENYDETVACIEKLREYALNQNREVMLHMSVVEQVDAAAALALVGEIDRIRRLKFRHFVHGTYPTSQVPMRALSDMGFFDMLQIAGAAPDLDAQRTQVYLKFLSGVIVDPRLADRFVTVIETHVLEMTPLARGKLVVAIKEAMNNTIDWAHPDHPGGNRSLKNRWWLSCRVDIAKREVVVVLFDQGVGIPKTLTPAIYDRIRAFKAGKWLSLTSKPTDGEIIAAATEKGRTGTEDGRRGRGFMDMKTFIDHSDEGELRVLSNRGSYHYMGDNRENYANSARSLNGTLIEWRFRKEGALGMEQ